MHRRSYYAFGSLRSTRGPAPAPPLNNKTPALLQTAFCVYRLVYVPPCVCTAGPTMHSARCARRGGQPLHPPKITRLLHCYRPPFVCTALCMPRLVYAPPTLPRYGSLRSTIDRVLGIDTAEDHEQTQRMQIWGSLGGTRGGGGGVNRGGGKALMDHIYTYIYVYIYIYIYITMYIYISPDNVSESASGTRTTWGYIEGFYLLALVGKVR